MSRGKKSDNGVQLPGPMREDGYSDGHGPAWVSEAIGKPGSLKLVKRFLSDDGDETALLLVFADGVEQVIRPARLITTRRLSEQLGALGFPVPYYQPPQLAQLGQAIGRIADRTTDEDQQRNDVEFASLTASWLQDCLRGNESYVLRHQEGPDIRAAIEHVRRGYITGSLTVPLIIVPARAVLLAWTAPARAAIRDRLGSTHDGEIGLQLQRAGLARGRLSARKAMPGERSPDMRFWVCPNGWQGVGVLMPHPAGLSGPCSVKPSETVGDHLRTHAQGAYVRTTGPTLSNVPTDA